MVEQALAQEPAQESLVDTLTRKMEESNEVVEEAPTEVVDKDTDEAEEIEVQEDGETQVSKEEEAEEEVETDEAVDDIEEEEEEITAPNSWKKEEKELFNSLDDNIKDVITRREKEREANLTKKTQELGEDKKSIELWNTVFDPYKEGLKSQGQSPQQYVSQLMQYDIAMSRDPVGTLKKLIQQTGVSGKDLGFIRKETSDDDYDFDYNQEREAPPKAKPTTVDSSKVLDMERQLLNFQFATDESGKRVHPFSDEDVVMGEMQVYITSGRAKTLQEAYQLSPTVKEKTTAVGKTPPKDSLAKTKKKVAKAKKAATSIGTKSASNITVDLSSLSLAEHLKRKMSEASAH